MKTKIHIPTAPAHPRSLLIAATSLASVLYGGLAVAQTAQVVPITVPTSGSVAVSALNRLGNVAGYTTDAAGVERAFFWDGVVVDQGTLGGSRSLAFDLNDFDQTTGYSFAIGDSGFRAFLGVGRSLFNIGSLGDNSAGNAINNAGDITGYSFLAAGNVTFHAFATRNGAMLDLGTLGGSQSAGIDINELGQVAGDSNLTGDMTSHGFFFDGAALHDIGALGGTYSTAEDLNNLGEVTGGASLENEYDFHAFLYRNGSIRSLGTLGGTFSLGVAINDSSVVAGDSTLPDDVTVQGFVWQNGAMTSVGHLGSQFSSVWSLNNSNQIVGVSTNAAGLSRAFLWQRGSIVDLNSLLPANSGWVLDAAYFINDAGQIVGTGQWNGQPSWYRLEIRADENHPPVARAGADAALECGDAVLDGSASSDPDGDALSFAWYEGEAVIGTGARISVALNAGVHTLRLRVTDAKGATAEDDVVITVQDVTAPQVSAPAELTRNAGDAGTAPVPDVLREITAGDNCTAAENLVRSQDPAAGALVGTGEHPIRIRVADAAGNVTEKTVLLKVVDRTAPSITSLAGTPDVIRKINKQMVPVALTATAVDNCDAAPALRIVRVESSDPVTGPGDRTTPDWRVTGALSLEVRAEVGDSNLRVYTVVVAATDQAGNSSESAVQIVIQKGRTTAGELAAVLQLKTAGAAQVCPKDKKAKKQK